MHDPHDPPPASQPGPRPAETHPMRFAVTCWVAMQYGDVLDAGTVLAILRRYQETAGDPAAAGRRDRGHRGGRPGRASSPGRHRRRAGGRRPGGQHGRGPGCGRCRHGLHRGGPRRRR